MRRSAVLTTGALIEAKAKKNGDKVFLFYKDDAITYAQIDRMSNRVANGLRRAGIGKGDKVCLMLPNCPEFLYCWFGLAKLGAVEVPVNTALKAEFLRYNVDHSDARAMVIHAQFLDRLKSIQDSLGKLETVIVLGGSENTGLRFTLLPFQELLKSAATAPLVEVDEYDTEAIIYTSGTTGNPKGVMLSHGYFYNLAQGNIKYRGLTSADIVYTPLPLFHANAQGLTVIPCLLADASVALAEKLSASAFWDEIRRYKATQFNFIGAMLGYILKQPQKETDADNPVEVAFGAPIPRDFHLEAMRRYNIRLVQPYGLTECGVCAYNLYGGPESKLDSFGQAADDFEVKIFDDRDNELPPGEVGEIVCRPKRPNVMMSAYYKMPDTTLTSYRNFWFHTGDYGRVDGDGYFYFVDRKKDYLRVAGENISSSQVEATLNAHPNIAETAALGIAGDGGENALILYVVLKPGARLTPEELMLWSHERLPRFAMPRYIEFLDALPKTPTERVEKYKLRERGVTPATWDRVEAAFKVPD